MFLAPRRNLMVDAIVLYSETPSSTARPLSRRRHLAVPRIDHPLRRARSLPGRSRGSPFSMSLGRRDHNRRILIRPCSPRVGLHFRRCARQACTTVLDDGLRVPTTVERTISITSRPFRAMPRYHGTDRLSHDMIGELRPATPGLGHMAPGAAMIRRMVSPACGESAIADHADVAITDISPRI